MTNDYRNWLREREIDNAALRGVHLPQPRESTLKGDVAVPALQAVVIGLALDGVVTGILLICDIEWAQAWRWGAGIGLCAFGLTVVVFIVNHHGANVVDPIKLAYKRFEQAKPTERPQPEDEPWRVIRGFGGPKAIPARVHTEVKSIEPAVNPEIKEMHDFITTMWPTGDITQANCQRRRWSRKYWDKYIGGKRTKRGQESGRGLLDRAGVIRKDGGKWVIAVPLNEALAINDELLSYAQAKAEMVKLSPTL